MRADQRVHPGQGILGWFVFLDEIESPSLVCVMNEQHKRLVVQYCTSNHWILPEAIYIYIFSSNYRHVIDCCHPVPAVSQSEAQVYRGEDLPSDGS
jgi:hypothetical protein